MNTLKLSTYDDLYIIDLDKVLYFQADDHYTNIYYTTGSSFLIPFGLSKIEDQLQLSEQQHTSRTFMRLGRKYIVNLTRLFHINTSRQELTLYTDNGTNVILQISKPVLRSLIELMA